MKAKFEPKKMNQMPISYKIGVLASIIAINHANYNSYISKVIISFSLSIFLILLAPSTNPTMTALQTLINSIIFYISTFTKGSIYEKFTYVQLIGAITSDISSITIWKLVVLADLICRLHTAFHLYDFRTIISVSLTFVICLSVKQMIKKDYEFSICFKPSIYTNFICAIASYVLGETIIPSQYLRSLLVFLVFIPEIHFSQFNLSSLSSQSRRLLAFFTMNFVFMFAEFIVGFQTNSLGLISDAFHMLCDNASLFFSLLSSILTTHLPTKRFPYGFACVEQVCSMLNVLLLFFTSYNLFKESIERLICTPRIGHDNLILVSVLGLVVNLLGLFFIGGDKAPSTAAEERRIAAEIAGTPLEEDGSEEEGGESVFLRSIFMHVLVDALGSVAVIISSLFVVYFDIFFLDPVISFGIALSLLVTTIELARQAVRALMQTDEDPARLNDFRSTVSVNRACVWSQGEGYDILTANVAPNSIEDDDQETLVKAIAAANAAGFRNVCIEVDSMCE